MERGLPQRHLETAEAAWSWVLDQVRGDDGPWIPESVGPGPVTEPELRDGMHSGIGGLAHVLAEIRLVRGWTDLEATLAQAITDRLRRRIPGEVDCTFFDGLPSTIGALVALRAEGVEEAVARLAELAGADGWPQGVVGPPGFSEGARINDATLGTAGVLLAALWARRHGVAAAGDLAARAAEVLLDEAEELPSGLNWPMVPRRFLAEAPAVEMPNLSHGLAGIATALAVAGAELGRPELADAARRGAEHLVTLGDRSADGFVVPRRIPRSADLEEVTWTWCHGPAGTSLLFVALDRAGVDDVAGESPAAWQRRCLHSVRRSGVPERLRPGFWDNDGRCCGTAGVADVFLDAWQRSGDEQDLDFARHLADVLVERATVEEGRAYWRFLEHRAEEPLLPPGVGWMQGAAGIAALLFRVGRVLEQGSEARAVARMDNWWALP